MTREEIVTRMAEGMAAWALHNEPLTLNPQTFRALAGAGLTNTGLLSILPVADSTPHGTDGEGE